MLGGVTVGRVEGIRLDPGDYSAIVEMSILRELQLPSDTMASIRTSGLIGTNSLPWLREQKRISSNHQSALS